VHDTEQVASADELVVAGALEDFLCGAYRSSQSKQDRASPMLLRSSYISSAGKHMSKNHIALERDFDGRWMNAAVN